MKRRSRGIYYAWYNVADDQSSPYNGDIDESLINLINPQRSFFSLAHYLSRTA